MTELKRIDFNTKSFEANGKKYFIEEFLSISRYALFEEFEIELAYGVRFKEMFDNWKRVYELCNEQKFADIAVLSHAMMNGISRIEERKPQVLRYCALFINEENEDRETITEDIINQKIQDWEKEGIVYLDFFQLAVSILPGFIESYKSLSQNTSLQTTEIQEEL